MSDITPSAMASDLALAYTSAAQRLVKNQSTKAQSTSTGLSQLQSALSAFETALGALSSKKSVVQRSATVTGTAIGNASAAATAQAGSYTLFVEKVATRQQIAFEDLPAVPVALGGPLVVQLGDGSNFQIDLSMADQDGDGTISSAEIARAVNLAEDNGGKVTATTVTSGGQTQLILSAGASGVQGAITLDTTGLPASDLKTALDNGRELVAAQDAVVWIGQEATGIRIQQASNTFTAIDGVTLTLSQAMASGTPPITLTVATDDSGTAANLQDFVKAYNALETALDSLTAAGSEGAGSAAFASDAGVRALRNRLGNTLRMQVDGMSLMDYGIKTSRDGSISLDTAKLDKTLAAKPLGLDTLFGSASLATPSGLLGAFHAVTDSWTDAGTGALKQRRDSVDATQQRLTRSQERVDTQYTSAYNRYLMQFTALQSLQARMDQNSGLFSALTASSNT